jgi:hypothetical protein
MYAIKLEDDTWIAGWKGDPGKTCVIEHAKIYSSAGSAKKALAVFKYRYPYRRFENAKIAKFMLREVYVVE